MQWDKKNMPDRKMISVDITSMYPVCMMMSHFPVGKPFRALEEMLSSHFKITKEGAFYGASKVQGCIQVTTLNYPHT